MKTPTGLHFIQTNETVEEIIKEAWFGLTLHYNTLNEVMKLEWPDMKTEKVGVL